MRIRALLLGLLLSMTAPVAHAADNAIYVTGYTCDPAHGQPYCGLTADGTQVGPGVAACPAWMPFGTVVRIWENDAPRILADVVCHDRGPANAIDVWEPTIADCYAITGRYAIEMVG